ncbi:MAG: hypothetical protein PVSMB1_12920 [Gemmatimonadaceae bacterium]
MRWGTYLKVKPLPPAMPSRSPRSLKHEYEIYVEREIEDYKDSVPRNALLAIGDEAVASLDTGHQFALTEMLLCDEVDRIIRTRLRIPAYTTWRRKRIKELTELRRPERWGLRADDALVRAVRASPDGHVLVAGAMADGAALYLAANGCEVTTIGCEQDAVQRVVDAAHAAGLGERVHAHLARIDGWTPAAPLAAVVCAPTAFAGLSAEDRARVIRILQSATSDGGVHLVETIAAGHQAISIDELRRRYRGWDISVERSINAGGTFLARKLA